MPRVKSAIARKRLGRRNFSPDVLSLLRRVCLATRDLFMMMRRTRRHCGAKLQSERHATFRRELRETCGREEALLAPSGSFHICLCSHFFVTKSDAQQNVPVDSAYECQVGQKSVVFVFFLFAYDWCGFLLTVCG